MKRFLYKEISNCRQCPCFRITSDEHGRLDYGYCKHPKTLEATKIAWEKTESMTASESRAIGGEAIFLRDAGRGIQAFCPLPKEFGIEVKAIGVRSGDLAVLKIPEALNDQRDSIVQSTAETLRQLDVLPTGLLVVIDDGAGLEMVTI